MRGDILICAVPAGWVLKLCGATTAILEFEAQDEALSVGSTMAARSGVNLVIEDRTGIKQIICSPLPSPA